MLARTTLNISFRMAYPFLPIIARGLGVPLEVAAGLVALRSTVGFASLAVGPLADRYRRRTLILIAVAVFTVGALIAAVWPQYLPFALGFLAMGLAKIIFDPTSTAYLSDRLPYAQRGRVLGLFELPYSLAALIGVPLVGLTIQRWGWQAPYWGLAALGALSCVAVAWGFPAAEAPHTHRHARLWDSFGVALANPSVRWFMLIMILVLVANDTVFIIYGAWLEQSFGLNAAALGAVSIATGLAELGGEGLSSAFLDRIGKKRGILISMGLLVGVLPLLPLLGGQSLAGAVTALVLLLLVFEFAFISCIPLISELVPTARATTLSLNVAAMQVGRVSGALVGPLLWQAGGLWANVGLAMGLMAVVWTLLALKVKEADPHAVGTTDAHG